MTNTTPTGKEQDDCVFCKLIADGKAYEIDAGVYRFTPLNPVVEGHKLFVSSVHTDNASESPAITGMLFAAASKWAGVPANEYNLITSVGKHATQTVFHLHVHYVPRVAGDGLHLPWTGQLTTLGKDGL